MKFIVTSGSLMHALNIAGKCISGKSIIPILDYFLFEINDNKLEVTASNNEVFLTTAVEIESKGLKASIAIPSVQLSGLIKSFPEQPLAFEINERVVNDVKTFNIEIKTSTGKYKLPAEDGENYPYLNNLQEIQFEVPTDTLTQGFEKTLFAVSTDQLRPSFCGVNLSFEAGKALFTATNQHILSTFSYTVNLDCNKSFIIPAKVLSILLASPKSHSIQVSIDSKSIHFQLSEDISLRSLLINERYVDYKTILPSNNEKHLVIDRLLFLGALKRVIQLSNTITKSVKLSLTEGQCAITAEDADLGQNAYEILDCNYQHDTLEIGLVGSQVIDCINKFDTAEVHLYFSTSNRAVLIRDRAVDPADKQNLMLTMPIMLNHM